MKYNKIMSFGLMSVLCGLIAQMNVCRAEVQPEVLDIGKTVGIIHNGHDCNTQRWHNKEEDTCQCCLSYGKGQFGSKKSADEVIDHCINESKQCTKKSIESLRQKNGLQKASSQDFLDNIYDKSAVVKKMSFDTSLLDSNGMLTEQLLENVLAQAYKEGKLRHTGFKGAGCLTAKSLGAGSGYQTAQLFLVTSTCQPGQQLLFIVKESKKGLTESTNLKKIEEYPGMKELIAPQIPKDLPTISLPFFYFSYHPHHKNVHYIATMPAASGMVLCDLITEFRDNQTTANAERVKRAYGILGKELANFHKRFMKPVAGKKLGVTVAHGDFHCQNIFYDEKLGHFTFIDNETMVDSFGKLKSPVTDFMRLIFPPFTISNTQYKFEQLISGVKPGTWFNITLTPFLKGYLSAYNQADQKQVLNDLRQILMGKIEANPMRFNQKDMHDLQNTYIGPIFDAIEKGLIKGQK
jgi:hypothetical protein